MAIASEFAALLLLNIRSSYSSKSWVAFLHDGALTFGSTWQRVIGEKLSRVLKLYSVNFPDCLRSLHCIKADVKALSLVRIDL